MLSLFISLARRLLWDGQGLQAGGDSLGQARLRPAKLEQLMSTMEDFHVEQDNLLDHLVPADAREDEAESSEQHKEAGKLVQKLYSWFLPV